MNIKDIQVERPAGEVANLAGETKTEAIRRALSQRKQRLLILHGGASKYDRMSQLLHSHIWPEIPARLRRQGIQKKDREKILGYGPLGY